MMSWTQITQQMVLRSTGHSKDNGSQKSFVLTLSCHDKSFCKLLSLCLNKHACSINIHGLTSSVLLFLFYMHICMPLVINVLFSALKTLCAAICDLFINECESIIVFLSCFLHELVINSLFRYYGMLLGLLSQNYTKSVTVKYIK